MKCKTRYPWAKSYQQSTVYICMTTLKISSSRLKFMFSKKATKIGKIFTVNLTVSSKRQIDGEDFVNFSGLLRKRELYEWDVRCTVFWSPGYEVCLNGELKTRIVQKFNLSSCFLRRPLKLKKSSPSIWRLLSKCQINGEDLVNFCGLLRKHDL